LRRACSTSRCFACCRDEDGGEFLQTKEILDELGVEDVTDDDCRNVRKICKAVSERAAYLASAGASVNITTSCYCNFQIFNNSKGLLKIP